MKDGVETLKAAIARHAAGMPRKTRAHSFRTALPNCTFSPSMANGKHPECLGGLLRRSR
jgi:hypothetical protein